MLIAVDHNTTYILHSCRLSVQLMIDLHGIMGDLLNKFDDIIIVTVHPGTGG